MGESPERYPPSYDMISGLHKGKASQGIFMHLLNLLDVLNRRLHPFLKRRRWRNPGTNIFHYIDCTRRVCEEIFIPIASQHHAIA